MHLLMKAARWMSIHLDPHSCVPHSYLVPRENVYFVTGPWAGFGSAFVTCQDMHAGWTFLVHQHHEISLINRKYMGLAGKQPRVPTNTGACPGLSCRHALPNICATLASFVHCTREGSSRNPAAYSSSAIKQSFTCDELCFCLSTASGSLTLIRQSRP